MGTLFWCLAVYGAVIGYLCSVLSCMFDGLNDEWWEPWVCAALLPFWWAYDNTENIMFSATFLVTLVLFFTLVGYLGKFCTWIWELL